MDTLPNIESPKHSGREKLIKLAKRMHYSALNYTSKYNCRNQKARLLQLFLDAGSPESEMPLVESVVRRLDERWTALDSIRPIKICRSCGAEFEQPRTKGEVNYCSSECQRERWRKKRRNFIAKNLERERGKNRERWLTRKNSEKYRETLRLKRELYASDPEHRKRVLEKQAKWRKTNPKRGRHASVKRYGITLSQFDDMVQRQGGVCAICRLEPLAGIKKHCQGFYVDHDHVTGEVRGLLCTNCNQGIGHLKDDVERLRSAIEYLNNPPARVVLPAAA